MAPRRVRRLLLACALVAVGCSGGSGEDASPSGPGATEVEAGPTTAAPTDPACATVGRVDRDVRYRDVPAGVDPDLVSLDVYRAPEGCPSRGVLVWVHGGGWAIGDKANRIDDKAAMAAGRGLSLVSVNYRLSSPVAGASVRWPVHPDDVAAAVAWVVEESERSGFDGAHLVLAGHSAGAGIVAELGTDDRYLGPHGLSPGDLTCVAPLDTEAYDVARMAEGGGSAARTYRNAFGDDPADWAAASPLEQVGDVAPAGDWFFVRRGLPERRALSDRFAAALEGAGATTTSITLVGWSHEDVNADLGTPGDDALTPAFETFLDGCLG